MKLLKYSEQKIYHYDNAEERLIHIEEMKQQGWSCSGRVKGFTGSLGSRDEVEDKSKYYYIGEFYKEEMIVNG